MLLIELLVSALLVVGGAFSLIGSWGLVRLPSLMARLHGPTKATTLGVGSCLVASGIYLPATTGTYTAHEFLITLFLFITAPVSAQMIAKAHLHRQKTGRERKPDEAAQEELPVPQGSAGWATFEAVATDEQDLVDGEEQTSSAVRP